MNFVDKPVSRLANQQHLNDKNDWAWRSEYWNNQSRPITAVGKSNRRKDPLMLCGHGVSMKIDAGTLFIRNGFTHHPQQREEYRFFRGSLDIPPQILMLDGSGNISFDVLNWLTEQQVALVRIKWNGEVASVLSGYGYAANPHRVQWQMDTRNNPERRMAFCIDLIIRKIEGCIRTLEKAIPRSDAWEKAISRAYADISTLELEPPPTLEKLRIIEANSAAAYFRAWRGIPLKWRGLTKNPIPDDWKEIGSRTSDFALAGNRNASHPVNAILNYAYAVLESQLRIKAVADGYDPTLGIMHFGGNGSSAFIFDIMEPERSKTDLEVLKFLKSNTFHPADFILRRDGVCRLNPQLAKNIAEIVSK